MKIMTQDRSAIIEQPRQVWVVPISGNNPDHQMGHIICNAYRYPTLGEYTTVERAREVLAEIFEAQRRGKVNYYMPKE